MNDQEEPLTAIDQIHEIESWLNAVTHEVNTESVSYGELAQIQYIYDSVKPFLSEATA